MTWDTQDGNFITKDKDDGTGLKLTRFIHLREVTEIFDPFKKYDGTRYELILGSYFQQVIVLYIFNGCLALMWNEVKVTMSVMV